MGGGSQFCVSLVKLKCGLEETELACGREVLKLFSVSLTLQRLPSPTHFKCIFLSLSNNLCLIRGIC